jgi:hypothetical protein
MLRPSARELATVTDIPLLKEWIGPRTASQSLEGPIVSGLFLLGRLANDRFESFLRSTTEKYCLMRSLARLSIAVLQLISNSSFNGKDILVVVACLPLLPMTAGDVMQPKHKTLSHK